MPEPDRKPAMRSIESSTSDASGGWRLSMIDMETWLVPTNPESSLYFLRRGSGLGSPSVRRRGRANGSGPSPIFQPSTLATAGLAWAVNLLERSAAVDGGTCLAAP